MPDRRGSVPGNPSLSSARHWARSEHSDSLGNKLSVVTDGPTKLSRLGEGAAHDYDIEPEVPLYEDGPVIQLLIPLQSCQSPEGKHSIKCFSEFDFFF